MEKQRSYGIWYGQIIWASLIVSTIVFGYGFWENGFVEEGARHAIAWSAKISVVLFSLAFSASAVHFFWKNSFTFWLRMSRRHLGISFAIIHLIHLGWLGVLQYFFHPVFEQAKTISLFGGGMAYLFLVLMLLTSFPYFSKKISPRNWKILHTMGGWWIWFIFARSYMRNAINDIGYIPFVVLLAAVLVFKLAAYFRKRYYRAPVQ